MKYLEMNLYTIKLLVGFILNVAKIKSSFLKLSSNPETKFKEIKTWTKDTYIDMCSKNHKGFSNIYLIKLSN